MPWVINLIWSHCSWISKISPRSKIISLRSQCWWIKFGLWCIHTQYKLVLWQADSYHKSKRGQESKGQGRNSQEFSIFSSWSRFHSIVHLFCFKKYRISRVYSNANKKAGKEALPSQIQIVFEIITCQVRTCTKHSSLKSRTIRVRWAYHFKG